MMWRQSKRLPPFIMFDNGAFSFWQAALRRGEEWAADRNWTPYYNWLEPRLFTPGRWAVIPDMPGAPSQLNDGLLNDWPFGRSKGAPLWHMDGPISRLLRLCEQYDRVCLGWTGKTVGCPDYHRRMGEVAKAFGNHWPVIHMMRGTAVVHDYPFHSADSTSLAQNGWRYDEKFDFGDKWRGRRAYADRLEGLNRGGGDYQRSPPLQRRGVARAHLGDNRVVGRGPDATAKQRELVSYLSIFDHQVLGDEVAWGEALGKSICLGLGCVRVDVSRPLERLYAKVERI